MTGEPVHIVFAGTAGPAERQRAIPPGSMTSKQQPGPYRSNCHANSSSWEFRLATQQTPAHLLRMVVPNGRLWQAMRRVLWIGKKPAFLCIRERWQWHSLIVPIPSNRRRRMRT